MTAIKFQDVGFRYDEQWVFRELSFEVRGPAILSISGISGSGKSTLLKLLAGLLRPTEGNVVCDSDSVAWVPQDLALFPWLTLLKNVDFPMRLSGKRSRNERRAIAEDLCKKLGIGKLVDRRLVDVSRGQAQRTAIARAAAANSDVVLLDEPFSALDEQNIDAVLKLIQEPSVFPDEAVIVISTHRQFHHLAERDIIRLNLDDLDG